MLDEPGPAWTDLALGLITVWLITGPRGIGLDPLWRRALWWAAIPALAGAVQHAFFASDPVWGPRTWGMISCLVVLMLSFTLSATVRDVLGPGKGKVFWALRLASLAAYGVLALMGHAGLNAILACESLTMVSVLGLWVWAYRHGHPRGQGMMLALAANAVAGATRALPSGVTELIGLDPISVYHLAQIPAVVLLRMALRRPAEAPAQIALAPS